MYQEKRYESNHICLVCDASGGVNFRDEEGMDTDVGNSMLHLYVEASRVHVCFVSNAGKAIHSVVGYKNQVNA